MTTENTPITENTVFEVEAHQTGVTPVPVGGTYQALSARIDFLQEETQADTKTIAKSIELVITGCEKIHTIQQRVIAVLTLTVITLGYVVWKTHGL